MHNHLIITTSILITYTLEFMVVSLYVDEQTTTGKIQGNLYPLSHIDHTQVHPRKGEKDSHRVRVHFAFLSMAVSTKKATIENSCSSGRISMAFAKSMFHRKNILLYYWRHARSSCFFHAEYEERIIIHSANWFICWSTPAKRSSFAPNKEKSLCRLQSPYEKKTRESMSMQNNQTSFFSLLWAPRLLTYKIRGICLRLHVLYIVSFHLRN